MSSALISTSQDENRVANDIGSRAYFNMVLCVSSALCYGVALSLFYASLQVLSVRHESITKARKFSLALTCFMFLMTTGLFISVIGQIFFAFSWAADPITDETPTYKVRWSLVNGAASVPYYICQSAFEIVNFIIGDIVVLWRAVVLWPHSRLIHVVFGFLLLVDLGFSLYDMVTFAAAMGLPGTQSINVWGKPDAARILVSMAVNLVATLCIAVRAWKFRRTLRLALSEARTNKSLVNQVLMLMIECGLVFCAVQIFYSIYMLAIYPKAAKKSFIDPLQLFAGAMGPFFSFFAGMYPSIFILVMAKRRSLLDNTPSFTAFSQNIGVVNQADMNEHRPLSTLRFGMTQQTGQTISSSQHTASNIEVSQKGGVSVSFTPEAEKTV